MALHLALGCQVVGYSTVHRKCNCPCPKSCSGGNEFEWAEIVTLTGCGGSASSVAIPRLLIADAASHYQTTSTVCGYYWIITSANDGQTTTYNFGLPYGTVTYRREPLAILLELQGSTVKLYIIQAWTEIARTGSSGPDLSVVKTTTYSGAAAIGAVELSKTSETYQLQVSGADASPSVAPTCSTPNTVLTKFCGTTQPCICGTTREYIKIDVVDGTGLWATGNGTYYAKLTGSPCQFSIDDDGTSIFRGTVVSGAFVLRFNYLSGGVGFAFTWTPGPGYCVVDTTYTYTIPGVGSISFTVRVA